MALDFNFGDLEQKLTGLSRKVSNELTDKALEAGGDIVLNEMVKNVPVDTGFLRSRLDIKMKGSNINRKADVGILNNQDKSATYGYYQEYGTARMVGKKWMKKSYQNSSKEAKEEISKVIVNEILKKVY